MASAALMLATLLWTGAVEGRVSHWYALYGDELLFEVYREGAPVGFYRQTFSGSDDSWQTRIEMDLSIPILFWDYRYRYTAEEEWQGDRLRGLRVTIDRNGRIEEQRLSADELAVGAEDAAWLLPTHHYDVRVIDASRVFNTLSWQPNRVTIEPMEEERLDAARHTLNARRYRYRGELRNVDAWYDDQGRWVGLRFLDERGAPMELRCVRCGRGAYL